jgi:hypothetical protein
MPDTVDDFGGVAVEEAPAGADEFGGLPVEAGPDLSKIKLSPYDQAAIEAFRQGRGKPESGMESGTELTGAIASDPTGFLKSIPSIVGGAMMAPGRLAFAGAADLVSKGLSDYPGGSVDKQYGGNLAAMMRGEDQLPAEKLIGSAAQAAPNLAVGANIAKSIIEMAPLLGMSVLPATINRIAAGAFSLQMIAGVKAASRELGTELGKPEEDRDAGKIASLKSDLIQTGIFAPLAGAGAASGLIKPRGKFQGPLATGEVLRGPKGAMPSPETQAAGAVSDQAADVDMAPPTTLAPSDLQAAADAMRELRNRPKAAPAAPEGVRTAPEAPAPSPAPAAIAEAPPGEAAKPDISFLEKPMGSHGPEEIAAFPDDVWAAAMRKPKGAGWSMTADATAWAMNQKSSPELLAKLKELSDADYKKAMAKGEFPQKAQWYQDAAHALSGDEVGLSNIARIKGMADKGQIKIKEPAAPTAPPAEPVIRESQTTPPPAAAPASSVGLSAPVDITKPAGPKRAAPAPFKAGDVVDHQGQTKTIKRMSPDGKFAVIGNRAIPVSEIKPASPLQAPGKLAAGVSHSIFDELLGTKPAAPEKGIASDWTSATDDTPPTKPGEEPPPTASLVNPPTGPTELQSGISIPKFANRKMSPLDRVTASHSGKLQKSFDEARRAQREIKAEVPSERRQNAISIWREAKGDVGTLQGWASAAKGKLFKQAATDAQTLTPKEITIATKVGAAFDALHARGTKFDVLRSHRDAYVPHVWDVGKPGTGFGTGMLKQRFRFSKARTFDTLFDGDQAGFKPKTLAIGKLLPAYIHEMNTVIADRQAVRDIVAGTNKDGSPMAVPRGNTKVVEGDEGKAVLVQPRAMKAGLDTSDYKMMSDQPALANWTWAGKDTAGRPVFMKSDLALHPDAYRRINAMIGQSALRQWYHDPVTGTAQIPRAILRGLDTAQSAMKREMFGLLAPFHQVQEGTHGVGHMVNPFSHIPKVDLRDPAQLDAANHGLMLLPDRASARVYLEGVGAKSSLLSQGIRKLGRPGEAISDVIDGYQDYLFHQYIPGLKFKTYQAILGRNMKRYAGELKSGDMTPADVKITSAEQSNAAYGHLNYALLDRNPTMQHLIQMGTLAPDFLEARSRFAGQAVKGLSSPVGAEQLKAIAILAAVQAGSAYILSNVTGGQYDPHHPFEVVHNGRRYAMRSVPEDIFSLLKDTRQFAYSRVNPLLVKGGVQLATGLNYRGEKTGPLDTFTELLAGYIPITARQLPGLRSLTETSRQNPVSPLQQLAGSLGLRISRYSPVSETYKLAGKWMDSQKLEHSKGSYPISKYQQLRYALEDGDMDRAKLQYDALAKTTAYGKLRRGFRESIEHPFTGKKATDAAFAKTLSGYNLELYHQAIRTRVNMLRAFDALPKGSGTASNVSSWYETSP